MPHLPGQRQVNILVSNALARRLDAAVAAEKATALTGRVSRSSVIRDALVAHLAATPAPTRRHATVAPRAV